MRPGNVCYACAKKDSDPAAKNGEVTTESTRSAVSEPNRANQGALRESNPRHRRSSDAEHSRIPSAALAAVERVLAHRAAAVSEVPGQERWRQTTPQHQAAKAASHALEAYEGTEADHETGEHPLAHAAARALLGLALALRKE